MSRRLRTLAALFALSLVVCGTAYAASLNVSSSKLTAWHASAGCTPGTLTLNPNADTYIDEDAGGSNFGTATTVKVRGSLLNVLGAALGSKRQTLARFNLPSLELCSLTSATLRLHTASSAAGRTLEALRVTSAWTETGVTWNSAPTTTTTGQANTSSGSGYRAWTVTTQVSSMYAGTNNGFLIRDSGGALVAPENTFESRESATNKPELVLVYG
ncbi:MAG TPA: DNRLRE domain-containing protein [Solirubrobacteraceae bacterium]|nr:DNRLRE domain-containing protein [Solirubrobacteraceae bacterium]